MTRPAAPVAEAAQPPPPRVDLHFEPNGTRVRVPPGVTLFDAASWNGIAIDSTCGGHGTCKKCRVKILDGRVPASPLDARAFSPDELRAGWRLACRVQTSTDLRVHKSRQHRRRIRARAGRAPRGVRPAPGAV